MQLIKVNHLQALGACREYVHKFEELFPTERFPDGVEPTAELCLEMRNTFDFYWAGTSFLKSESGFVVRFHKLIDESDSAAHDAHTLLDAAYDASVAEWASKWPLIADRFSNKDAVAELKKICDARNEAIGNITDTSHEVPARLFVEMFADDANVRDDFDVLGAYVKPQPEPSDPDAVPTGTGGHEN